jgi:hypothetical protein
MATNSTIKGLPVVISNLNREIAEIRGDARIGLLKAAQVIKGASVRNSPIDLGNLRSSHFVFESNFRDEKGRSVSVSNSSEAPAWTEGPGVQRGKLNAGHSKAMSVARTRSGSGNVVAIIGASAFYAIFVHEGDPGDNYNSGAPQFLKRAVEDNRSAIIQIVRREARI